MGTRKSKRGQRHELDELVRPCDQRHGGRKDHHGAEEESETDVEVLELRALSGLRAAIAAEGADREACEQEYVP